jgi:glycosyltransferase involved in cell wall biosynthesis
VQRSAGFETGLIALYARAARRRSIFSSSSEVDFDLRPETRRLSGAALDKPLNLALYRLGLRLVDKVVVQTDVQRRAAAAFRVATAIPSFCPVQEAASGPPESFLWIGAVTRLKDPLAYVELARRVPDASFTMVAVDRSGEDPAFVTAFREQARSRPNLTVRSGLPRREVLALYERAVAVVNTSVAEGFPNTFLEGWARGVPSLSLRVDPDGAIGSNRLGTACEGSFDAFVAAAETMWQKRQKREAIEREQLQAYVRRVHDPSVVGPRWVGLVRELLDE